MNGLGWYCIFHVQIQCYVHHHKDKAIFIHRWCNLSLAYFSWENPVLHSPSSGRSRFKNPWCNLSILFYHVLVSYKQLYTNIFYSFGAHFSKRLPCLSLINQNNYALKSLLKYKRTRDENTLFPYLFATYFLLSSNIFLVHMFYHLIYF